MYNRRETAKYTAMYKNPNMGELGKATRFSKENPRPGPGRPRTKIIREYVRQIVEEEDPKTKKIIARQLAEALVNKALATVTGGLMFYVFRGGLDIRPARFLTRRISSPA